MFDRKSCICLALIPAALLAAPALAQPANDSCSGALPVVDGDNAIDTKLSTLDTPIPCMRFGGLSGPEVWYSYTAPVTGIRNFEITNFRRSLPSGSPRDSELTIYSACGGAVLACDEDGGINAYSKIYHFSVTAGTTYIIRVGNPSGVAEINKGVGTLRIAPPPAPIPIDDCSLAQPFAGQGDAAITTIGLTNNDQQPWDCEAFYHDGWIAWTPSVSGIGVVDACDAGGVNNANGLQLGLYDTCGGVPLLCAAEFQDAPNAFCTPKLCYEVTAGHTYYVRYGHLFETSTATGNIHLDVRPPNAGITIPANAIPEPGDCADAPAMDLDGGCQVTGEIPVAAPQTFAPLSLCQTRTGTASSRLEPLVYDRFAYPTVDQDWYVFTLDSDQTVTINGEAEFVPLYRILTNCPSTEIKRGAGLSQDCTGIYPLNFTTTTLVAGTYYFAIAPQGGGRTSSDCGHGDRYWFSITGSDPCTGACCGGATCAVSTQAACTGTYQGDGTACGTSANPTTCCAANFDGVNGLQVADIFSYLNAWFAGDPRTDFDGVGGIQVGDIFSFLNAWFAGC